MFSHKQNVGFLMTRLNFQLLPKLHDIANQSQNPGGPVEDKIKQISEELKVVLEQQMKVGITVVLN